MSNANFDLSESDESGHSTEDTTFAEILLNFEQQHTEAAGETVQGTIVSVGAESILVDIGRKTEGVVSVAKWQEAGRAKPEPGLAVAVIVGRRDHEGYYQLSIDKVVQPKDWTGLQAAFADKAIVSGTVTEQVKGGFRVDIGVRAFLPASRSGVRETDEMPKLVGQEIQCRITKLDTEGEDVVVDRRAPMEEEQAKRRQEAYAELREGSMIHGRVRSVMDFGAFVEIMPGVDGLLHIVDMAYSRIGKASDHVKIGDELDLKILKLDPTSKKISLGLKQLQEDPWSIAARSFHMGDRVHGTVSRLADFGAFVELLPGVDGLIHLSELSWDKRVRKPGDLLKIGDRVEAVILQVNVPDRRIGLGYKQVLGDPWDAVESRYPVGTLVEGTVANLTQFGAFVDLAGNIEGMIHISDITNEKRLDHPKEKIAKGQSVKAVVLEVDTDRRRLRLGMKQLEPTTLDHYISEHQAGETVSGRLVEVSGDRAKVELGEGVIAMCKLLKKDAQTETVSGGSKPSDVGSLSAMLAARWKQGESTAAGKDTAVTGQVRRFRIANLDAGKRLIEIELAS